MLNGRIGGSVLKDDPVAGRAQKLPGPRITGRGPRRLMPAGLLHRYGLVLGWLLVVIIFSSVDPQRYLSLQNFQSILNSQLVLLLIAMAQLIPIVAGDLDFSVAANVGLVDVVLGYLVLVHHWDMWPAAIVALAVALAVSSINAFLIVNVGVEALIVTLGMFTLLSGLALGVNASPIGGYYGSLQTILTFRIGGLQLALLFAFVICILLWFWFKYLPSGRHMHFIGASPEVARLAGIRVPKLRWLGFLLSGTLAGVAGIMLFGILGGSDPTIGPSQVFPAASAVILGSTAITPGIYNVAGTFVAVYLLVFGITGLELLGFSGWVPQVFYGGALVAAVVFSRLSKVSRASKGRSSTAEGQSAAA